MLTTAQNRDVSTIDYAPQIMHVSPGSCLHASLVVIQKLLSWNIKTKQEN